MQPLSKNTLAKKESHEAKFFIPPSEAMDSLIITQDNAGNSLET